MKRIISIFLALFMTVQLCACGETKPEREEESSEAVRSNVDVSAIVALDGRDNTLDSYTYTIRKDFDFDKTDGSKVYRVDCALGENSVYIKGQHEIEAGWWQEFIAVDQSGKVKTEKWEDLNQRQELGTIVGTDRYILYNIKVERAEPDLAAAEYEFQMMDERGQCIQTIPLPQMAVPFTPVDEVYLQSVGKPLMDGDGFIYYVWSDINRSLATGEVDTFLKIVSADGEYREINLGKDGMNYNLIPSYDGCILLFDGERVEKEKGIGLNTRLRRIDREAGELTLLASIEDEFPGTVLCASLLDEENMVYVNRTGLYKMNLETKETEELYRWIRHGISVAAVETMRVYEDGRIGMIYRDGDPQWHYISLSPTIEKIPVQTITFVTTDSGARMYHQMITDFNKLHPNCIVEVKTDYDQTALLTQLIAGDGPVLIDTRVTGFAENKKFWEPLDGVLTDLGIYEQLQSNAMEIGKIDGTLFGIVDSFMIDTVIAGEKELKNWDYNTFIQCMEKGQYGTTIVNRVGVEKDGTGFLTGFFVHGLEDSYLFDTKTGKTIFKKKDFQKLLQLTEQYVIKQDYADVGEKLLDGTVLCNRLTITKPEKIALYRIVFGEDVNYIGYPGKDGSCNYLTSGSPLAIRHTASKEDKELAVAFLAYMLSYEAQMSMRKDLNFHLSVRKDVLETQIEEMNEETVLESVYFDRMLLKEQVDNEKDKKTLYNLIENSKPMPEISNGLLEILHSELIPYFDGKISVDALCENLDNRVGLYLMEQN